MKIVNYFDLNENIKENILRQIKSCDWISAKFLAELIEQEKFQDMLGGGKLFLMLDEDRLVSFCTLAKKDCINDDSLYPWIGFVFTVPEYRGNRYSGQLIDYAFEEAEKQGFDKVYVATDHIGLYEKYGFEYMENRLDIYGEDGRVYVRKSVKR